MRLLLLEDDNASRKLLAVSMRRQGYAVDAVASATEASGLIAVHPYDALVVDVGLPEGPTAGLGFVADLRDEGHRAPVLFLSARGELDDRVAGLDAGGDDYLVKPCHLREIDARLRALVRRNRPTPMGTLERGELELDWNARAVKRNGQLVHLTAKEYGVMSLLAGHPGKVYSREEIISHVWDESFLSDDKLVNVYVKTLRRKLGADSIETVRGLGYRFPA